MQRKKNNKYQVSINDLNPNLLFSSQIGVAPERVYDDAFTLQEVTERDSNNFNYVCGMVPMVLNMVTDVSTCIIRDS